MDYSLERDKGLGSLKNDKGYYENLNVLFSPIFKDNNETSLENTSKIYLDSPDKLTLAHAGTGSNFYEYKISALNSEGESLSTEGKVITGVGDLSVNPVQIS